MRSTGAPSGRVWSWGTRRSPSARSARASAGWRIWTKPTAARSGARGGEAAEPLLERLEVDRLHHEVVEAGDPRLLAMRRVAEAGEGDQEQAAAEVGAQPAPDFGAVHVGQLKIDDRRLGPEL